MRRRRTWLDALRTRRRQRQEQEWWYYRSLGWWSPSLSPCCMRFPADGVHEDIHCTRERTEGAEVEQLEIDIAFKAMAACIRPVGTWRATR